MSSAFSSKADTCKHPALRGIGPSTASQTAWALIGLLETVQRIAPLASEFTPALERGVDYLCRRFNRSY